MKRKTAAFLMVVGCGALMAEGCAKSEVVKKDQPMAPSAAVAPVKVQPKQEQAKPTMAEKVPVAQQVRRLHRRQPSQGPLRLRS